MQRITSLGPVSEARVRSVPVIGYATGSAGGEDTRRDLLEQANVITEECERRGLDLIELVRERAPADGKASRRPGLAYALDRIAAGEVEGLVVSELSRLTHSAAELGNLIARLDRSNARLVAAAHALDTQEVDGRLAADLLIDVSRWEYSWLSERTRRGLEAARSSGRSTGRAAVVDFPNLSRRIAAMRTEGMTLQAIADRFNEEGVPTVRGGTKWRHSSVQRAAGYRRPPSGILAPALVPELNSAGCT